MRLAEAVRNCWRYLRSAAKLGEADPGDAEVACERGNRGRPDQVVELLAGVGVGHRPEACLRGRRARNPQITALDSHLATTGKAT